MKLTLKFTAYAFLIGISVLTSKKLIAQVSGTITIPGDYPTITAALNQINAVGLSGPTILELQPGYVSPNESFPIVFNNILGGSATNTLTLRPSAGATGRIIASPFSNATIDLLNVSNVIIDGRPGGFGVTKELTIQNYDAFGEALRFSSGANNNTVKYCTLTGANTTSIGGVVFFDTSAATVTGNIMNTIAFNVIKNDIIGVPYNGIYSSGRTYIPNSGNSIINNEILNFSNSGIDITSSGNGGNWTITGNSFYNNLATSPSTPQTGINFKPGLSSDGNTIENNFIGGQGINASGAKWINTGAVAFTGIYLSAGTSSGTALHNNVIKNIALTSGGAIEFTGVSIASGLTANNGNIIGSATEPNSITVSGSSSSITGILVNSAAAVSITGDNIGNITTDGVGANITGIKYTGGRAMTIMGNNIHDFSANNTGNVDFTGVYIAGGGITPSLLHGNTVQKIALSSTQVVQATLVSFASGISSNNGNIIGSATEANSIVLSGSSSAVTGILVNSSDAVSISDDIIGNITATSTGTDAIVNGILIQANGYADISGNRIQRLTGTLTKGIFVNSTVGSATVTINKNILAGNGAGTGIETAVHGTAILNVTVSANTISNWAKGFLLFKAAGAALQQSIHENVIAGNQFGFDNQSGVQQNATCNWWGNSSGPGGAGSGTGDAVSLNVIFSPWATISTFVSVNAGPDQTIYIGYGSQSKTLTAGAVACGGTGYLWSTGSTASSITVSPTVTTTYTVTVTDAAGHTASDNVTVFVQDIRCEKNKIFVCHRGAKICINIRDVQSHLNHGDALGACSVNTTVAAKINTQLNEERLLLQNYPNPFYSKTTIHYTVNERSNVSLKIFDQLGKEVIELVNAEKGPGKYSLDYHAADRTGGIYFYILITRPVGDNQGQRIIKKMLLIK